MAVGISRPALHYLLWTRMASDGTLHLQQGRLAQELSVSKFTMSRVLRRMVDEGRLVQLPGGGTGMNSHTYEVVDPAEFVDA